MPFYTPDALFLSKVNSMIIFDKSFPFIECFPVRGGCWEIEIEAGKTSNHSITITIGHQQPENNATIARRCHSCWLAWRWQSILIFLFFSIIHFFFYLLNEKSTFAKKHFVGANDNDSYEWINRDIYQTQGFSFI